MQLEKINGVDQYHFTAYSNDYVLVNQVSYSRALMLMLDLIECGSIKSLDELKSRHFTILTRYQPTIVLLATGLPSHFLRSSLMLRLIEASISFKAMNTHAACHTFNLLSQAKHKV